jgi:hypothetical protein
MNIEEIDVVGLQILQALLHRQEQVLLRVTYIIDVDSMLVLIL